MGQRTITRIFYIILLLLCLLLPVEGVLAEQDTSPTPDASLFVDTDYIEKAVDSPLASAGTTLTYSLLVKNPLDQPLQSVVVRDHYDARLENLRLVSEPVGTVRLDANTVIIENITLSVGESLLLTLQAEVSSQSAAGTVLSSVATLEAANTTIHLSNETETTIIPSSLPATGEIDRAGWVLWKLMPLLVLLSVLTFAVISLRTYKRLHRRLLS